jgi:hypothetical protein
MARNAGHLHDVQPSLKKSAGAFLTQVMKLEIMKLLALASILFVSRTEPNKGLSDRFGVFEIPDLFIPLRKTAN